MVKKTEGEICPYCGSEFSQVDERHTDLGYDANQEVQLYLFEHRTCTNCHRTFVDCYILKYDGYYNNEGNYDRNGEIMPE